MQAPLILPVTCRGTPRIMEFDFARETDIAALDGWLKGANLHTNQEVRCAIRLDGLPPFFGFSVCRPLHLTLYRS
jgi:hypothetical protein